MSHQDGMRAMTTLYKLTCADDTTRGGCPWGVNIEHRTSGEGDLCGPGWTHWYTDPLLAVLLNPIHGDFDPATMHLWEGEGDIGKTDHGLKVGCARGRTIRQIEIPVVTTVQRVAFGILCALEVNRNAAFVTWARRWLDDTGRSAQAAEWAAAWAAWAANELEAVGKPLDLIALARKAMEVA